VLISASLFRRLPSLDLDDIPGYATHAQDALTLIS
jgi:hypothetical protein